MNYIISIINPESAVTLLSICEKLKLSSTMVLYGRGTASKSTLDLLGIESRERRIVLTAADNRLTREFIGQMRRNLYIDTPGRGIVVSVPIKSVGGGKSMEYLNAGKEARGLPKINYEYELILAIANEGHADEVMDAARATGAAGGTILHGKGTGAKHAEKFYKISIVEEKEVLIIVSKAEEKAGIMSGIVQSAGPGTPAGAVVFSLPVSDIAGLKLLDDSEE